MKDAIEPRDGPTWHSLVPPARWLAQYRAAWLPAMPSPASRWRPTRSRFRSPMPDWPVCLRRSAIYGYLLGGLGYALLGSSRQLAIGPTSAISLMIAGNGRSDGGRRRAALRADRQPHRLHRRRAVPDRLAAAAERARQVDQRQHPRGLQGRRGVDHRHDPVAEPVRRGRAAGTISSSARCCWPGSSARRTTSYLAVGVVAIVLLVLGERLLPGRPVALGVVALSIVAASVLGPSGARGARRPERFRPACRPWRGRRCGCVTSRGSFRWPPDACCSPISKASPPRAPSPQSTAMRWTRGRSCSASARRISRRRSGTAIRSRADCRNRRSTTRPARARPLALVFASITLALCLLFLTGLLENLPKAVLAAVVLTAVSGLLDFPGAVAHVAREPARLLRRARSPSAPCCCWVSCRASCSPRWPRSCCCCSARRARTWRSSAAFPAPTTTPTSPAIPKTKRCPA